MSGESARAGFEAFYRSTKALYFKAAYEVLHSVEEAEDIRQDAYLKMWRAWDARPPKRLVTWGYVIVTHTAIDRYRRLTGSHRRENGALKRPGLKWPQTPQFVPLETYLLHETRGSPDPLAIVLEREAEQERLIRFEHVLAQLPESDRVLLASVRRERTTREIAQASGRPVTSLKTQKYRALRRAREIAQKGARHQ